jgi:flap endonuclease-1
MGVRNLNKIIQSHAPSAHSPFKLANIQKKNIGIDAFLWLYELKFRMKNNRKPFRANFTEKIFPLVCQNPANIFFVFDGKPPPEKRETLDKRKEEKNRQLRRIEQQKNAASFLLNPVIQLTKNDISQYKQTIRSMKNMSIIFGKDEAEATLARLEQNNEIQYIFSNDTDILPLGSSYVFKKNNSWMLANVETLKRKLNMDQSQLIDLCIILGNDFNPGLRRVGPVTAIQLIREYHHLENIISGIKTNDAIKNYFPSNEAALENQINRMKRTKQLFSHVLGDFFKFSTFPTSQNHVIE